MWLRKWTISSVRTAAGIILADIKNTKLISRPEADKYNLYIDLIMQGESIWRFFV